VVHQELVEVQVLLEVQELVVHQELMDTLPTYLNMTRKRHLNQEIQETDLLFGITRHKLDRLQLV
jgi:hypothetical protein